MKNTELKAIIKAASAKGMKKPELFILLHAVLSPEPLERFAGYVRYLENKFGTTDLIYRYTGGVGASVRFYIRSNADTSQGAAAISFDVKGDTWVIPDDLPFADRTETGEDLRARDNFNNLKSWLGQFTHAAGRMLEVEREIAKAREKSEGANDYSVDANRDTKKLVIKFNGGKLQVVLVLNLNQRNQIAANVAEHAVITWPTGHSDHQKDLAGTGEALADFDHAERQKAWKAEDDIVNNAATEFAELHDYTPPSSDTLAEMSPFVRLDAVEALKIIQMAAKGNVEVVAPISTVMLEAIEQLKATSEEEPAMVFFTHKAPWLSLFVGNRTHVMHLQLFFKDNVLVNHLVATIRERRRLEEFFSPSKPTMDDIGTAHALFILVFNCRDQETYDESVAWLMEQHDKGCKGFALNYAADDEGRVVITLGPDYSQYEKTGDSGMAYTYDGALKLIKDDLVEEPAPAAEEQTTAGQYQHPDYQYGMNFEQPRQPFSFGALGQRFQRPSGMNQSFRELINVPLTLDQFKQSLSGRCESSDAYVKIVSALSARVGSFHPDTPVVLMPASEMGVLDLILVQNMQRGETILSLRVGVETHMFVEPVRPYGLPMRQQQQVFGGGSYGGQTAFGGYGGYGGNAMPQPVFKAEVEKFFDRPMNSKELLPIVNHYSLTPEHANAILDVIHRRGIGAAGYVLSMDNVLDRAVVCSIDHNGNTVQIATIGFVNGRFADIDRDSENLAALLRNRGDRPSRFTDRPAHVDSGLDMPQPDELHVREVADAPNPEPRVFPLSAATRIDFADRETAIDFLQFAAAGMPNWIVSQAVQFINLAAANIRLPSDVTHHEVTFRVVLNEALCVHVLDRSVDPMIVQATLRLPRK